jgi:hypothetical protein
MARIRQRGFSGLMRLIEACNSGVKSSRQIGMCTSKRAFDTPEEALQGGRCTRSYECPYCHRYHGTNAPKK